MKVFRLFKHYWVILLTVLVISFWLGFSITELVNQNNTYYSVSFETNEIEIEDVDVTFFLEALKKYNKDGSLAVDEDGNQLYSYSTVKPNEFYENNDIEVSNENLIITISIKAKYFIGSEEGSISNKSLERFEKVMKKVLAFNDVNVSIKEMVTRGYITPFEMAIYSLVTGFIVSFVVMYLLRNKLSVSTFDAYKNGNIYRYPISKKYWIDAFDKVRKLKVFDMSMISILFALQLIMKFVKIPTGFPGLDIVLNYLIFALITVMYGPIWGVIIGFGSDIIGFIMNPVLFHFGYTIQAMLTGLVYGLCLYKTEIKFSRVLIARIIINIVLNGVLGSFLWGDYSGWNVEESILYMWAVSIPKNIIYLIPQSILLYVFLRAAVVLPIKKDMIPKETLPNKYESLESDEDFA